MNKMRYLRIGVALAVLAAVLACTFAHVPAGTLCALCPVGFAEIAAASGSVPWALLPGVLALLAVVALLGRVFCSWVCPTSLTRNLFGGRTPRGLTGRTGTCAGCATGAGADGDPNAARTRSSLAAQGIVLAVLLVALAVACWYFFTHFSLGGGNGAGGALPVSGSTSVSAGASTREPASAPGTDASVSQPAGDGGSGTPDAGGASSTPQSSGNTGVVHPFG